MDYHVFEPVKELAEYIKCFWILKGNASDEPARQRIVPDGCMEMIFHRGDLFRQYLDDGSSIIQPRAFVFGQITHYLDIEPTGKIDIISARFHPDGLLPILTVPVNSITNQAISLQDLFGVEGQQLENAVLSEAETSSQVECIENFLRRRLAMNQSPDAIIKECVEVILRSRGQLTVDAIAQQMQINRRNLERRFSNSVGMSPKQLSKAIRLQCALNMLEKKQFSSLTSLAYEAGYYDQAHFIKDFKEFTGISPKQFYANHLQYAYFFASES